MINEKCINVITEELGLKGKAATKFFDSFWKFVEEELIKTGIAEINGMGVFSLEHNEEQDEYSIKFVPSSEFKNELGVE